MDTVDRSDSQRSMNSGDPDRRPRRGVGLPTVIPDPHRSGSQTSGILRYDFGEHRYDSFDMLQDSDGSQRSVPSLTSLESLLSVHTGTSSHSNYVDAPNDEQEQQQTQPTDAEYIEHFRRYLASSNASISHGPIPVTPIRSGERPRSGYSVREDIAFTPGSADMALTSSSMISPSTPRLRRGHGAAVHAPPSSQPPKAPRGLDNSDDTSISPSRSFARRRAPERPQRQPPFSTDNDIEMVPEASFAPQQASALVTSEEPSSTAKASAGHTPTGHPPTGHPSAGHPSSGHPSNATQLRITFGAPRSVSDARSLQSHGSEVSEDGHIAPSRQVSEPTLSYIKNSGRTAGSQKSYLAGIPRLPHLPIVQPNLRIEREIESRDPWGRREAPLGVSLAILIAFIAFPPFWLVLSAGYFDSIFGVFPRAIKLVALLFALAALVAAVVLTTTFAILKA